MRCQNCASCNRGNNKNSTIHGSFSQNFKNFMWCAHIYLTFDSKYLYKNGHSGLWECIKGTKKRLDASNEWLSRDCIWIWLVKSGLLPMGYGQRTVRANLNSVLVYRCSTSTKQSHIENEIHKICKIFIEAMLTV